MRTRWSRDEVLRQLASRRDRGDSLQSTIVAREARPLYDAATRYFGSYAAAARPFGLRAKVTWTEPTALSAIRRLARSRSTLRSSDVPAGLLAACTRLFGSWAETCQRAGIETDARPARRTWTRERVLGELRDRVRRGESLAIERIGRSLRAAIARHFGGLDQALAAAELA
jgi:hypothetical protein